MGPDLTRRILVAAGIVAFAALLLVLLAPGAAAQAVGGPDATTCTTSGDCRYRWRDSTAAGCPSATRNANGPCPVSPALWDEIATTSGGTGRTVDWNPCAVTASGDAPNYGGRDSGGAACDPGGGTAGGTMSCIPLGFTFKYYGSSRDCVWVHTDGHVKLASTGGAHPGAGLSQPTAAFPSPGENDVIAAYWTDMAPSYCSDYYFNGVDPESIEVYTKQLTAPDRFVIEWNGLFVWDHPPGGVGGSTCVPPSCTSGGPGACRWSTFQLILYKDSNNIDVILQDVGVNAPASGANNRVAIGINNGAGQGLNYLFTNAGHTASGRSIRFYPNHIPTADIGPYKVWEDDGPQPIQLKASDPDWDCMNAFTVVTAPTQGTLTLTGPPSCPPVGGTITTFPAQYTPTTLNFYGMDPFTFAATDAAAAGGSPGTTPAHLTSASVLANIEVQPVNDQPFFEFNSIGASGPVGSISVVESFLKNVKSGPATPPPNEENEQAVGFIVTPADPSYFTVAGQPTIARTPSSTSGTFAAITFTAAKEGTTQVCVVAQDSGGTVHGGIDKYPLAPDTQCGDITLTPPGSGGGSTPPPVTGVCGVPEAAFNIGAAEPREGDSVAFADLSTVRTLTTPTSIVGWRWAFGDGHSSEARNPSHTFDDPGTYTITLTVFDAGGCSDSVARSLMVGFEPSGPSDFGSGETGPVPDAGADRIVKEGEVVTIKGFNKAGAMDGVRFSWLVKSVPPVVLQGANSDMVTFTAPMLPPGQDVLSVVLGLRLSNGRVVSIEDVVTINVTSGANRPVADAGDDREAVRGATVLLDASRSKDLDGDKLQYRWTQVGGPTVSLVDATGQVASFVVPASGTAAPLEFQLNVTDGRFVAADTVRIYPRAAPAPTKGIDTAVRGLAVGFASDAPGKNWTWDFGDGAKGYGPTPQHTYAKAGTYTVRVDVTDEAGTVKGYTQELTLASKATDATQGGNEAPGLGLAILLAALGLALVARRK